MSEGHKTKFVLRLPDIHIELKGEKTFVEEIYRAINRDFSSLIEAAEQGGSAHEVALQAQREEQRQQRRNSYTWVYLCTAYFNKVYILESARIEASMLGLFVDIDRVRRVYVDDERSPILDGLAQSDRTLWAEFTEEGKAALRGAMAPNRP